MLYAISCAAPDKEKEAAKEIYLFDNQTNDVFDASGELVDFTHVAGAEGLPNFKKVLAPVVRVSEHAINAKSRSLKVLKIQLGMACNYHCSYCLQAAFREKMPQFPDANLVNAFFNKMKEEGISVAQDGRIELWGGEPLVYWKSLVHLIPRIREQWGDNTTILMITNGSLLTPAIVDFLMSYRVQVVISHDGPGFSLRNDVDPLTIPEKKETWLYLLDRSIEANVPLGFNVVLTPKNCDLKQLKAFFRDEFSPRAQFGIEGIVSHSGAKSDGGQFSQEDARRLDNSIFEALLTEPECWTSLNEIVQDLMARLVYRTPVSSLPWRCNAANSRVLAVDIMGRIVACHSWPASEYSIGHLWDYSHIKNERLTHCSLRSRCPHCLVLSACKGGCPHLTEQESQACCPNEFIYYSALFSVAWFRLTGKIILSAMPIAEDPQNPLSGN